ncbi:PREDICTED: uncharacterized protein LOC104777640 isoform X2 [Camelina sativa]|uniref:Uncharacterized protein LOC104777640 isoform X2 n=1 Tax=Camelina sativa TaxID=90675 RepID=A0ABM0YFQ1_CAMSA|nr:PREDICTED: uncharacterized protein LOC104777640 isoform X2 [Camelina sativa]
MLPKPLYKVKQSSGEKGNHRPVQGGDDTVVVEDNSVEVPVEHGSGEGDEDLQDQGFNESTDDLLEDGEFDDDTNLQDSRLASDLMLKDGTESVLETEDNLILILIILAGTHVSDSLSLSMLDMNSAMETVSLGKRISFNPKAGKGVKQAGVGKHGQKAKDGSSAGGGSRPFKKGMVALPKPPAQT